jgi:hypothetical protein
VLYPPYITVTAASLTTHDLGGRTFGLVTDCAVSADHLGDYLFIA